MNPKNITPAISKDETGPNELSAEEFQKRLYTWFEDRGLLSELRAHLRMQMISILRESSIGKGTTGHQSISPKVQAINLLIAEFLLNQDYYYTLSIFSSEAPMINVIPDSSSNLVGGSKHNKEGKKWRFRDKDMWDILEALGIQGTNENGKEISSMYFAEDNREALLVCVLRVVNKNHGAKKVKRNEETAASNVPQNKTAKHLNNADNINGPTVHDLNEVLAESGLNDGCKEALIEKLTQLIITEQNRKMQEQREAFAKLEAKLNEKAAHYENDYKRRMERLTHTFEREQKKLHEEQKQKQVQLDIYSDSIHKQNQLIRNHLNEIITRDRALEEKEQMLEKRQVELEKREKQLQSGYNSLNDEKATVSQMQSHLTEDLQKLDGSTEKESVKSTTHNSPRTGTSQMKLPEIKELSENGQSTSENHRAVEDMLLKGMVRQIQLENAHLKSINNEQMLRIQELNHRASALCRELEDYGRAHSFQHSTSAAILSSPPTPNANAKLKVSYNGGGEEGVRVLPTPPPRLLRNLGRRESRRKVIPKRAPPVPSTSSSEEPTPSDEVLRETKERLKTLEQESAEIDRNFRRFNKNRNEHVLQTPCATWVDSCRQAMFDVADFFYNDNDEAASKFLGSMNDIPSTSKGHSGYDFGRPKFKTDANDRGKDPAFNFNFSTASWPFVKNGSKPKKYKNRFEKSDGEKQATSEVSSGNNTTTNGGDNKKEETS